MNIIIEGIDHCGKDTLIDLLMQLAPGRIHHCGKPIFCQQFVADKKEIDQCEKYEINNAYYEYQKRYFTDLFRTMVLPQEIPHFDFRKQPFNTYFNRFHLGEYVYGYLYRDYSSEQMETVFKIEEEYIGNNWKYLQYWTKLILLAMHHPENRVHDNEAFSNDNGKLEQQLFLQAFNKSKLIKGIIFVDTPEGKWRPKSDILTDVLHFLVSA